MSRRGTALLLALATLVAIGLLGAIALSVARVQRTVTRQSLGAARASWAAQAGVARILADWRALGLESLSVGASASAGVTTLDPLTRSADSVVRLGKSVFEVRVSGERLDAGAMVTAREPQSVLVLLLQPAAPDRAAAWASGPVRLSGMASLSGGDAVPAGWDSSCPGAAAPGPGVLAQGGSTVDMSGCTAAGCLSGTPPIARDTLAAGPGHLAALHSFWGAIDTLIGGTVSGVAPLAGGGICTDSAGLNWGAPEDPAHPCFDLFRVVGARSGTALLSGTGQGLLLGEGDLVLDGDFRFYGVVAASGSVILRGRSEVVGTVLAGLSGSDSLVLAAQARLARSVCAVRRALAGTARPVRLRVRGWFAVP